MTSKVSYFHDHTHNCACGGWRHEAVDCEYTPNYPCPLCDVDLGLVPMSTGTKLVEEPFEGHLRLAYEGE